jgi:hypothetical protein
MRGSRSSVDKSKRQSERGAAFAKAGRAKMFGPRSGGPDSPGRTGKVETPASGARSARGGKHKTKPQAAQSAKAGATGAR